MAKKLSIKLLSLALLLLFQYQSKGQTYLVSKTEILGDFNGESYRFQTDLKGYMVIRTDEAGSMVWMSPMKTFGSDSSIFCQSENEFIVAGITKFNRRGSRIDGRPSDYEYWLVPFDEVSPGFFCMPNPTKGPLKIIIDSNSDIISFMIYDQMSRLLLRLERRDSNQIDLDLDSFSQGSYIVQGIDSKGNNVQTIKIIKQ